jgi:hypothetical protein
MNVSWRGDTVDKRHMGENQSERRVLDPEVGIGYIRTTIGDIASNQIQLRQDWESCEDFFQ